MHWIQFAALLCWSLTPQFSTAVYVPDASDNPGAWVPLSPGDTAPVSGPDLTPDENNVAVWNAQFTAARDSGAIAIWPGGTWAVNGVLQTFGAQWHATSIGDSDLDGLPDDLDPCPGDAANNSSWWPGGTWIMNGVSQTYGGQWHLAGVGDADNDGIPDDLDPVPGDAANNSSWWQGGTWIMNGVSQTFSGQWHLAGAGDADMDGIPDDLDPVPGDAANNSFYWQGGAFTKSSPGYGNIYHIFCSGWFAGAATDANGDGLPDVLDDWFTNPSAHGTLQQFPGGTFLIEGAYSTFDPVSYFAAFWVDADGDLLPDELDPFPTDAWNSTHYDWPGGDFYINGVLTHFAPARYNGLLTDADDGGGDGIPDVADPYPLDPANNSAFWQGGQFTLDFVTQNLPARWHRADAVDADNDSIPDDFDPYLNDAGNPTLQSGQVYWAGGTFRIDGQLTTYPGVIYSGSGADGDADGLPGSLDAWPEDPSNNSAWWPGGTFTILGQSQALTGQWHRSNSGDQDGDAIPDDVDPYPSDANNGITQSTFWAGGTFIIDGQSVFYAGHEYTGDFNDSDGDGLLNFADPYPNDTSNNSFYFAGGEITLNNIFVRFAPGWYAGSASDGNFNGVPDSLDDWFADPSPHGTLQNWSGGTFTIEGQPRIWPALKYYAAGWNDADSDGIPNEIDPHPLDQSNNIGFTWPATQTTLLYGNVQTTFSPAPYGGIFADTDADTIPNQAESAAYLNDPWNGNDTDGDFIPDSVEVQYPSLLDRSNPSDAAQPRPNDGISYLALHQYNIQHPASAIALDQPFPARDSDADSMSDAYELRYALQPFDRLDALGSPANDLIFNFEKAAQSTDPATPIVETNYVSYSGGQSQAAALSHHDPGKDAKENDWDGDKISNIDELFVFGTNAREAGSRPSDGQLIAAITSTQLLSTTTLINFRYLVYPCDCSNANCPHDIICNYATQGSTCACAYPPPPCGCANTTTCSRSSTCVCTGNCFPPPPTCNCGGNICPITGCSCNGTAGVGNCTWTANCGCISLGCPGKTFGGFCTVASPGGTCPCGGIPGCLCLKSGCPTSTCTCSGTATCGGPGFCPGCVNMNCVSSGCSCAGSGTCPSPPPPCNCGMGTCPGTTIANDGACSHFYAGACSGCCYCGHSGCPGGYCSNAGQGTAYCSCNTYCNGSCGTTGCPGTGCMCAYAGNCVPVPCGGNGGIPCGATNGVVSCPGAGCTCGGLSSLNSLSSPGSCVPPLPTVEIKYVDRDDPTKTWTTNGEPKTLPANQPVYSGKVTGDLISWALPSGSFSGSTLTWTAERKIPASPPVTIAGPSGTNQNEWKLTAPIDWQPGTYRIKCVVGGVLNTSFEIEQRVGVRTDDVVVVGWIDPTPITLSTTGVQSTLLTILPLGGLTSSHTEDQKLRAGLLVKHISEVGVGSGFVTGDWLPITNDSYAAFTAADKTYALRWMFKYGSNSPPPADFSTAAPSGISGISTIMSQSELETFAVDKNQTQYKLINHYQVRFLTTADGKFDGAVVVPPNKNQVWIGNTKDPARLYEVTGWVDELALWFGGYPSGGVFPGQAGTNNWKRTDTVTTTMLSNEGRPDAKALDAFSNLAGAPAVFDIWSTSTFFSDLGHYSESISPTTGASLTRIPKPTQFYHSRINTQIYPTYWIYVNGVKVGVQAQNPDPAVLLPNTDKAQ